MIRQIIHIDEEKCNGCGICADACHEGAIDIVDGKAKLVREHFCDGLGDCLPNCPTGAITFEEREAPAYDEAAVMKSQQEKAVNVSRQENAVNMSRQENAVHMSRQENAVHMSRQENAVNMSRKYESGKKMEENEMAEMRTVIDHEMDQHDTGHSCPGSRFMQLDRPEEEKEGNVQEVSLAKSVSRLAQWPCQLKLLPVQAPFYDGAKLLIAADCTAYAYANMHEDFMKGKVTVIGCPKLDAIDYTDKLTEIIRDNDIKSVTIVRMEVPCCGGLQRAAENALKNSGKFIPWQVVTVSRDGRILD